MHYTSSMPYSVFNRRVTFVRTYDELLNRLVQFLLGEKYGKILNIVVIGPRPRETTILNDLHIVIHAFETT